MISLEQFTDIVKSVNKFEHRVDKLMEEFEINMRDFVDPLYSALDVFFFNMIEDGVKQDYFFNQLYMIGMETKEEIEDVYNELFG